MGASKLFLEGRDREKKVGESFGNHVVGVECGGLEERLVAVGLHKAVEETEAAEKEVRGTAIVADVAGVPVGLYVVVAAAITAAVAAVAAAAATTIAGVECQTLGNQLGERLDQVDLSTSGRNRCSYRRN